MAPNGDSVLRSVPKYLRFMGFLNGLAVLVLALVGAAAPTQAGKPACCTGNRLLLAQSINPDLLKTPQAGRVCCVAGTRRFHSTADACRLRGGVARPLTACSVTVLEKPICCVKSGRAAWRKPSECRQSGGRPDETGRRCRAVHVGEQVCCRRAGNAYATSAGACKQAGGGVTSWQFCPRERTCCRKPNAARAEWTSKTHCRRSGGRSVEDLACDRSRNRSVCCKAANGRLYIRSKTSCLRRLRGTIRPDRECRLRTKDGNSTLTKEICCARRGRYYKTPTLNCLSDGGRKVEESRCVPGRPQDGVIGRYATGTLCCRTTTQILRTTRIGCGNRRGTRVADSQCERPQVCCQRSGNRGYFRTTAEECRRSDGTLAQLFICGL